MAERQHGNDVEAADDETPAGADATSASARNELRDHERRPDAIAVEEEQLPPEHPARGDEATSAGETESRPRSLPTQAGRPGRTGGR